MRTGEYKSSASHTISSDQILTLSLVVSASLCHTYYAMLQTFTKFLLVPITFEILLPIFSSPASHTPRPTPFCSGLLPPFPLYLIVCDWM